MVEAKSLRDYFSGFCVVNRALKEGNLELRKEEKGINACVYLWQRAKNPCILGEGKIDSKVMIVGFAPAINEDERNRVFVGRAGEQLNQILNDLGIDRTKVYITNAVKCLIPAGDKPPMACIKNCSAILREEILKSNAEYIIALGEIAFKGLMSALINKVNVKFERGKVVEIEVPDPASPRKIKILSTYHPAYLLRNPRAIPIVLGDIKKFLGGCKDDVDYQVLDSYEEVEEFVNRIVSSDIEVLISLDLETEKLDSVGRNKIICVGIGLSKDKAVIIPYYTYNKFTGRLELNYVEPVAKMIVKLLEKLFTSPNIRIIGHNIKYDALVLKRNFGIDIKGNIVADTRVMHHLINEQPPHDLKTLTLMYGSFGHYSKNVKDSFKNKAIRHWYEGISIDELWRYCAFDVCATYELYYVFKQKLEKIKSSQIELSNRIKPSIERHKKTGSFFITPFYTWLNIIDLFELVMENYKIAIEMEEIGVPFSKSYLNDLNAYLGGEIRETINELNRLAGMEINWNSSKQLTELLLKLGLPVVKRTNKGNPSFDKEALEILAEQGYEIPQKLLYLRRLNKMKTVYANMLGSYSNRIVSVEGDICRLACEIDVCGTESGRWSTKNPSLHTIPRENRYRNMVQAPEGWVIMSADYSMAELRVIAAYANCKSMLDDFASGVDFHSITASRVFRVPLDKVTSEIRTKAKSCNFGIIYCISAQGLAKQVGCSVDEAQKIIDDWFTARPEVKDFIDKVRKHYYDTPVGATAYFMNVFGRLRRIPRYPFYIEDDGKKKRNPEYGHAERECVNFYPQSTVADILHLGLVRLKKRLVDYSLADYCKILLTIHDAVLLQVKEEKVNEVVEVVKEALEYPVRFAFTTIALPVDISWDKVWKKD